MILLTPSMQRAGVALPIAAGVLGLAGCGPQAAGSSAPNAMSATPATANAATDTAVAPQNAAPAARVGQPVPAESGAYRNPQARAAAPAYVPPVQTAQ
ncbi:MAG TPA: hypothetical protein VIM34_15195, partial [Burkholderiaceae bacterium]